MALDVATAKTAIHSLFESLESKVTEALASSAIPLLGAVAAPSGSFFFAAIEQRIAEALDSIPAGADPAASIAAALSNVPGFPGISATVQGDDVAISFGGSYSLGLAPETFNLGATAGSIGLDLDGTFATTAVATLAVTARLDGSTGQVTLVDNGTDEIKLGLTADLSINGEGDLGFLKISATDKDPATHEVDVALTLDLPSGDPTLPGALPFTLSGQAGLDLEIVTTTPVDLLPTISTEFVANYNLVTGAAEVSFKDVTIDVGSLLGPLSGIFRELDELLNDGPVGTLLDIVVGPLPLIDDLADKLGLTNALDVIPLIKDGDVSLADLLILKDSVTGQGTSPFFEALAIIDLVRDLSGTLAVGKINLGSFDLTADPLQARGTFAGITGEDALGQLNSLLRDSGILDAIPALKDNFATKSGFNIPLLEDPSLIVNVLLNSVSGPTTLIEYDLPDLNVNGHAEIFLPLLGPIGLFMRGAASAHADLAIGYDTAGLAGTGSVIERLAEGLYFTTEARAGAINTDKNSPGYNPTGFEPVAIANAKIDAGAGVRAVVVEASVSGGIGIGVQGFFENDDGDGRLRLSEIADDGLCFLDPLTGRAFADVQIEITIGFDPFSFTKRIPLASTILADFDLNTCHTVLLPERGLAHQTDGELTLHTGTLANLRELPPGVPGQDVSEFYAVRNALDSGGNPIAGALDVAAFGFRQSFGASGTPVTLITGNLGQQNDTLVIARTVTQDSHVTGNGGSDYMEGGAGRDTFDGGDGNDYLVGNDGNDVLRGGNNDDVLDGGNGADDLYGDAGHDKVSYEFANADSKLGVYMARGLDGKMHVFGGDADGDTLSSIEDVIGSQFDDILQANDLPAEAGSYNTLEGLGGDDVLTGASNRGDYLIGGAGGDWIDGGIDDGFFDGNNPAVVDGTSYLSSFGAVTIDMQQRVFRGGDAEGDILTRIEAIQGSSGNDTIRGDQVKNILDGWNGDDVLEGRGGTDTVRGGAGNDTVFAAADGDKLDGGGSISDRGRDLLTYRHHSSGGVTINLATGVGSGGDQIVLASRIEAPNSPVAGYSTFEDLEGTDIAASGDNLSGDLGDNTIRGLAGNDTLFGNAGNDTLIGGAGADVMNGGLGIDVADYSQSAAGVTVNLLTGTGIGGDAQGDTLVLASARINTIENLRGSDNSDVLTGDDGANTIDAGLSLTNVADIVNGGAGADRLIVDYSRGDLGKGIVGGFTLGASSAGSFSRQAANTSDTLDSVNFSLIQHLTVIGTIRADTIYGGGGDDVISTGSGNDIIVSGLGADNVSAGDGNDTVTYGTGIDRIMTTRGGSTTFGLDGGRGIDTLSVSLGATSENVVLVGGAGGTEFNGTNLSLANGTAISNFEIIKDVATGFGNDLVWQDGLVNNRIDTGWGADIIVPGFGNDFVSGGFDFNSSEVDILSVGGGALGASIEHPGLSKVWANPGDLLVLDYSSLGGPRGIFGSVSVVESELKLDQGGGGYYRTFTNEGTYSSVPNSTVSQGLSFSEIERIFVKGTNRGDILVGTYNGFDEDGSIGSASTTTRGNDRLEGLGGDDILVGYTGHDTLLGGDGDDILLGADPSRASDITSPWPVERAPEGNDLLTGGAGADTFVLGIAEGYFYSSFSPTEGNPLLSNRAIITDFTPGDGDRIQLHGSAQNYRITEINGSSFIVAKLPPLGSQQQHYEEVIGEVQNFTGFNLSANYVTYVNGSTPGILANGQPMLAAVAQEVATSVAEADVPAAALAATAGGFTVAQQNDADVLRVELGPAPGISNIRVTIDGNADASGTFSGDPFGLGAGIVLSTGRVEDLVGPNTSGGAATPNVSIPLTFEKIGRVGATDIFRADLSGLGIDIRSLTLNDSNSQFGGGSESSSGFDIDFVKLSRTFLTNVDNLTADALNGAGVLPPLNVFDFSAAGLDFRPGTQRGNPTAGVPLSGVTNTNLVLDASHLGRLDADGSTDEGNITLGDGGRLAFNLTQAVSTNQPLYLYVGEDGASGETLEGRISVSSASIRPSGDLSTDLGAAGPEGDRTKLTYAFTPDAGLNLVEFQLVIFSEELPEFGGAALEDAIHIRINGEEVGALSDGASATLSSLALSPVGPYHPDLILNPSGTGPAAEVTRADAYTQVITVRAHVAAGVENVLEVEVADGRDGFLDTGVLIKAGSFRALVDASMNASGGGAGGSADPLVEGGRPGTYHIERPADVPPTENVDVTLKPSDNIDLGNGAGKPVTVTFTPGGPSAIDVPVRAVDIPGQDPRPGRVDAVVTSDDPNYDGQHLPPWGYQIEKSKNVAPEITSGAEFLVAENTTKVTTVTATDLNVGQTLTYEIVGGVDRDLFKINAMTGELTFVASPDFENPSDVGGDNVYNVAVRASDNGNPVLSDEQAIAVRVRNVAETSTINVRFVSEAASYKNTFGWYDTRTGLGAILFDGIEAEGRKPTVKPGVTTASFVVPTAELANIAYFLIPGGGTRSYDRDGESNGAIKVVQLANGSWAVAPVDGRPDAWCRPDILPGLGANALFTETSKNAGQVDYASSKAGPQQTPMTLSGDTADGPTGLLAWEDLAAQRNHWGVYSRPGDADYNDAVFDITEIRGQTVYGTAGAETLTGGAAGDVIFGEAGNDSLNGGAGDDWLDGGAGQDRMAGGIGDDTYIVDVVADVVMESAGAGLDTVLTSLASYSLGTNVENLSFTGTGGFAGTGNGLANTLVGGSGADVLSGLGGADRIEGRGGNDRLIGGDGADTFVFKSDFGKDVIADFKVTGSAHDVLELDHAAFAQFATARQLLASSLVAQVGSDVVITADQDNAITLQNVSLAALRSNSDDILLL